VVKGSGRRRSYFESNPQADHRDVRDAANLEADVRHHVGARPGALRVRAVSVRALHCAVFRPFARHMGAQRRACAPSACARGTAASRRWGVGATVWHMAGQRCGKAVARVGFAGGGSVWGAALGPPRPTACGSWSSRTRHQGARRDCGKRAGTPHAQRVEAIASAIARGHTVIAGVAARDGQTRLVALDPERGASGRSCDSWMFRGCAAGTGPLGHLCHLWSCWQSQCRRSSPPAHAPGNGPVRIRLSADHLVQLGTRCRVHVSQGVCALSCGVQRTALGEFIVGAGCATGGSQHAFIRMPRTKMRYTCT